MTDQIVIRGARLHNLKNINLSIPKNRLVVLTGLSGSGKSTLGFDILYKESQRQFMEALGMVTFGLARPPVDAITGLLPAISIDQHLTNHSPRSTVGTSTDVYTYLRVLFARLGHRPCPACGQDIPPSYSVDNAGWEDGTDSIENAAVAETTFPCPRCGHAIPELGMANFSFNKPEGACPTCTGLGIVQEANTALLVDEQKSIADGAVIGWDLNFIKYSLTILQAAAGYYGFSFDPTLPLKDFSQVQRDLLFYGVESPHFRRHFPQAAPPGLVREGRFEGIATALLRRYADRANDPEYREKVEKLLVSETCPDCAGARLRPESRSVTIHGQNIIAVSALALTDLGDWLKQLPARLVGDEQRIAAPILDDLQIRIERLVEVGAGYLAVERPSVSVSAGEAQRLRLASLLGSELSGVLYIFDEPTIGMHQRDTRRLITVLRRLRDLGNTILVIEHDLEMIAAADHVIDFGPGGGKHGGQVIAAGTAHEIREQAGSLTGDYLAGRKKIPLPPQRRTPGGQALTIHGARHHNLQNLSVRLPLGMFVAVTGVSGSGKSSLIFDILGPALRNRLHGAAETPGEHDALEGWEHLDRVISIGQEHAGRIPRSNAATYSDIFTPIRAAFAATPEARKLGLSARHFSFNVPASKTPPGGRCERCEGAGVLAVKMQLLPDVEVQCPACHGRRFTRETLAVHYRGLDISQVLDLTVEEALELFSDVPAARSRLQVLADVGLGYLQLGQPATTLSGGEIQRVKLTKELGRKTSGQTLYLLDEPTTGLHLEDTARLLGVLQRLVEAGNSVIVVEHNLELIKTADWVIDLGPEGGQGGGKLLGQGTPEEVARIPGSFTGQFLRETLHLA